MGGSKKDEPNRRHARRQTTKKKDNSKNNNRKDDNNTQDGIPLTLRHNPGQKEPSWSYLHLLLVYISPGEPSLEEPS